MVDVSQSTSTRVQLVVSNLRYPRRVYVLVSLLFQVKNSYKVSAEAKKPAPKKLIKKVVKKKPAKKAAKKKSATKAIKKKSAAKKKTVPKKPSTKKKTAPKKTPASKKA